MARRSSVPNPAQLSLFDDPAPAALIPAPRVPEIPPEPASKPETDPEPAPDPDPDLDTSTGCD